MALLTLTRFTKMNQQTKLKQMGLNQIKSGRICHHVEL